MQGLNGLAADILLAAGADATVTDRSGRNGLHLLLARLLRYNFREEDNIPVLKALLEAGCSPSALDDGGWTPLHVALETGQFSLGVMLETAVADITVRDPRGDNALHHVGRWISRYPFRRPKIGLPDPKPFMLRFLQAGIDVNGVNLEGETPLFRAVEAEFTKDQLQLYLDSGANIKARNVKGQGLLHVVAAGSKGRDRLSEVSVDFYHRQDLGVVLKDTDRNFEAAKFKLLMDAGLDPYLEDNSHRTPLDVAAASGLSAILRLFAE